MLKVHKIMQKDLVTVSTDATIRDAALRMKYEDVGSVLIVDENDRVEGIVTDRDIALAVGADHKDPEISCLYEIMSNELITIPHDADIDEAIRIMNSENVRRLPVCDNGKLVGLLSSADIAHELKEEIIQFIGLEEAFIKHS
jgi:CBS domain-containing protein